MGIYICFIIIINRIINFKVLATILCLIHCNICSSDKEKKLSESIGDKLINNSRISRADYFDLNFWFEEDSSSHFNESTENYDRAELLKFIIYEINRNDDVFL